MSVIQKKKHSLSKSSFHTRRKRKNKHSKPTNKKPTHRKHKTTYRKKKVGGVYWDEKVLPLPTQKLSFTTNPYKPKKDVVDDCLPLNADDTFVNITYTLSELPYNSPLSPIYIFKPMPSGAYNNYDTSLKDGIHNFILFWDETMKNYVLATSYFNAPEYGSKHFMMIKRLNDLVPKQFIFSGEFKKDSASPSIIRFHDWSSLYFIDNFVNFKTTGTYIWLLDEIIAANPSDNFEKIKDKFIREFRAKIGTISENKADEIKNGILTNPKNTRLGRKTTHETYEKLIEYFKTKTIGTITMTSEKYEHFLQEILKDAFKELFGQAEFDEKEFVIAKDITIVKGKEQEGFRADEYGSQKDIRTFVDEMCHKDPKISFNLYNDDQCTKETNLIGTTC